MAMSDDDLGERARALIDALRARHWHCATAESCTGGGVAAAITDIAGSSDVLECGYVTYSNAAKSRMLGVDAALIDRHGAVSEAVARAMAEGARTASGAECAVAVTGVAGPGGGTPAKPVGRVCFAYAVGDGATASETLDFAGGRAAVRRSAVARALEALTDRVVEAKPLKT
jgi:nicotinamide-nucleotide amidase